MPSLAHAKMAAVAALSLLLAPSAVVAATACSNHWVDIWGTMPQLVEPSNLPNPPYNGTNVVFQNTTLRQTIYITQDASVIRLQISNAFGGSDLPITAAAVALPASVNGSTGAGSSAIQPDTLQHVTFSGSPSFTVPNGAIVLSDPLNFTVKAQTMLSVSLYLAAGQTTNFITGHPGSRTTSWYGMGNLVAAPDVSTAPGSAAQHADHWYFLTAVEAWLPGSHRAIVAVGDSITDGRGSTTNGNDRWPDQLLARLQSPAGTAALGNAKNIAVLNGAAGGNRILFDSLGPNALGRIDRDVLAQPGVRWALIFEGVNDIGTASPDQATQDATAARVIAALDQMAVRLHRFGIAVFGATITPFSGPGQAYSDPVREAARQRVNAWIRSPIAPFDAVVDFDRAVRDPANATQLNPLYNFGDYLHLNPAGYKAMADTVDLSLFAEFASPVHRFL